jgi:phosphoribosylaminoimidazole-succinocarboxamide synthase
LARAIRNDAKRSRPARIKKLRSGKVREVFDLGEILLFVVTDRPSAFDVDYRKTLSENFG